MYQRVRALGAPAPLLGLGTSELIATGVEGVTVRTPGDLKAVEDWLDRRDVPLVVDAKVTPTVAAEWLEEAFRSH